MRSLYTLLIFCFFSLFLSSEVFANIIGSPVQNFNPNYSQRDFITVQSANPIPKNKFHLTYIVDYAAGTLPSTMSNVDRGDKTIFSSFTIGYGINDWWDLGFSFPYAIDQSFDSAQQLAQFGNTGLLQIRGSSKFRLLKTDSLGVALIGHVGINRTDLLPYIGEDPGPSYALEVAIDKSIGKWLVALNAGVKAFNSGPQFAGFTAFEPFEIGLSSSLGLRYMFNKRWHGVGELWAFQPDTDYEGLDRSELAIEGMLGLRYKHHKLDQDEGLDFVSGLSTGINDGTSTPSFRGFAGLRYIFGLGSSQTAPKEVKEEPVPEPEPIVEEEAPVEEPVIEEEPEPILEEEPVIEEEPEPILEEEEPESEPVYVPEVAEEPEETQVVTINDENTEVLEELQPKKTEVISFENINFYFDSYVITKDSYPILEKILEYLNKNEFVSLEIWGHTDNVGANMYNEKLSLLRAGAVYYYLVKKGIPKEKMRYDGWGERKPVVPNTTSKNRYKNRRVEFVIRR